MRYFLLVLLLIVSLLFPVMAQERKETRREPTDQARESAKRQDREKPQNVDRLPKRQAPTTDQASDLPPTPAFQKTRSSVQKRQGSKGSRECRSVFNTVREGLSAGNIANFAHHFGSQVSVNLRGAERGNYSGNQAYYILENYLRSRKIVYIDFSKFDESDANPFATGSVAFNVKGNRELAQVYVSLSSVEERWVITQINIY